MFHPREVAVSYPGPMIPVTIGALGAVPQIAEISLFQEVDVPQQGEPNMTLSISFV